MKFTVEMHGMALVRVGPQPKIKVFAEIEAETPEEAAQMVVGMMQACSFKVTDETGNAVIIDHDYL
jgi:hypothetical protein